MGLCLIAGSVSAQTISPDGTEGLTVTSTEGTFAITPDQHLTLNGSAISGLGSALFKCVDVFVLGIDNAWWRWNGTGWTAVGPKPACAPVQSPASIPVPPVVAPSTLVFVGDTVAVAATHDCLNVDRFTVSDNGVRLIEQTRDAAACVNQTVTFRLPNYATPGPHTYLVEAVNANGASAGNPVTVNVQPKPPAWSCTIPAANTKYANGDLKVTLRCPSTFPGVKGNTVTVTK